MIIVNKYDIKWDINDMTLDEVIEIFKSYREDFGPHAKVELYSGAEYARDQYDIRIVTSYE